jgi:hypothetical protein
MSTGSILLGRFSLYSGELYLLPEVRNVFSLWILDGIEPVLYFSSYNNPVLLSVILCVSVFDIAAVLSDHC